MLNIAQARSHIIETLRGAGIEESEARRESDLILEHVTALGKARQMAYPEQQLTEQQEARLNVILEERRKRFPLQYLLGRQWFMGLPFNVRPGVLIPRPDTETLVQVAIEFLRQFDRPLFADIGTGSGAIAVSVLKALPDSRAYAVDISAAALAIARENAELNGVAARLQFIHCDWLHFCPEAPLHAVLSNPPYVPISLAQELQPEVAVFEPKEALFGVDEDGLGFFRHLCKHAPDCLRDGGLLAVEVGAGQAAAVEAFFREGLWHDIRVYADLNRIPRCISALHAVEALEK